MIFSGLPQANRPTDSKKSQASGTAAAAPVAAKIAGDSIQPRTAAAPVAKPTVVYFGKSPAINQPAAATPSRPPGSWW